MVYRVYMNKKVFIKLIQKKTEAVVFSADYDKYIKEAETEGRRNLMALASTLIL